MFTELQTLLRKGDTLVLQVSRVSDTELSVNVLPKLFTLDGEQDPERKVLNTPLTVTGTVEELDSPEFAATLTRFTTSATTFRQSIDEVEQVHKAAAEANKNKPGAAAAARIAAIRKDKEEKKPEPKAADPVEATQSLL